MHFAHRAHPMFHSINCFLFMIAEAATQSVQINHMDGAFSNARLVAHWQHQIVQARALGNPPPCGCDTMATIRCQSHATHLIQTSILAMIRFNLLSRMYSFCCFIRNLGYFLRLQQAARQWINDNLDFDASPGNVEPDDYITEIIAFISFWKLRRSASKSSTGDEGGNSRVAKAIAFFRDMFNCNGKLLRVLFLLLANV